MSGDETPVQAPERAGFGSPRWPGDTRPPFAPGNAVGVQFQPANQAHLSHGAYSPRRYQPLAAEVVEGVLAAAVVEGSATAYLAEPAFRPALWAWGEAEAKCQLLREYLEDRADGGLGLDADGEAIGAAKLLLRYEATAERARDRLGLSPLARARLGRDVASAQVDRAELERLLRSLGAGS